MFPNLLNNIIQMGSMSKFYFSFLSQVFSFIVLKDTYNQMLKSSSPYATLHFNSNVCIKTWQLTTHHQTYPYIREIKILMHKQTQKLQNDQHFKKIQNTHFFFHSFSLRHEHEHYCNCTWLLTSYIHNNWHVWLPTNVRTLTNLS